MMRWGQDMNEKPRTGATIAAIATMGINVGLAVDQESSPVQAAWPMLDDTHAVSEIGSSVSFIDSYVVSGEQAKLREFANNIASVYAKLLEGQEPLGAEFEAVWDAHAEELYSAGVQLRE